jgi:hypothetical protein
VTSRPRRGRCRLPGLEQRREYQLSRTTQTLSRNQHRLLVLGMHTRVFSEPDTDFLNHRDAQRFSTGVGLVVLSRAPYAFRQSGRMEEEPFSWLTLAILFTCVRVDTCHPWNCMRSTSTHHPCTSSLAKNLG